MDVFLIYVYNINMFFGKRKNCIACKRKRDISKLKIYSDKAVVLRYYVCNDLGSCLHYQLKNIKKRK